MRKMFLSCNLNITDPAVPPYGPGYRFRAIMLSEGLKRYQDISPKNDKHPVSPYKYHYLIRQAGNTGHKNKGNDYQR